MKKGLIKILFTLLGCAMLFGCVPTPVADGEDGDKIDLYDTEFFIYQINGISQSGENPMLCTVGTDRADMVLSRIADIEEEYNCAITFTYKEHTDGAKDLLTASAISKHVADIVVSENINNIYDLVSGNLLYDILAVNDIIGYDSTTFDIYGAPEHLEAYMYKGSLLAVTPIAHPGYLLHRGKFILADTEIVTEQTGLDLRELHEKEEWTWNVFETVLTKCTVMEGTATKIYGGVFNLRELLESAMASNGYTMITKNFAGNYVLNDDTSGIIGALEWVRKLSTEYEDNVSFDSGWVARAEAFVEGRAAMVNMGGRYLTNDILYKKENFALLPFPCGTLGTYGEHASTGNAYQGLSIYNYCDDPYSVALILQAYCQPFEEYPNTDALKSYYEYMLWDQRDIDLIFDSELGCSRYNYAPLTDDDFFNPISSKLLKMSSAQILQTHLPFLEEVAEEWIIPNYELIDELYAS